jgi:PAS domain S-box-containing protein
MIKPVILGAGMEMGMAEKTNLDELALLKEQLAAYQLELETGQAKHEHTLKVQSALYRIAEAASTVHDMQEFYAAIHRIVAELMYAKNCYIATYDEQTNLVSFPYWVDLAGDKQPAPCPLGRYRGATDWVIQHGEVLDDASGKIAEAIRRGEMETVGTPSKGIAAPLKADGKTLGVILVQSYEPGIAYRVEDADLLSFVAQHIGVALARARAIELTHQRNAELEIINSVQHGLAAQLDIQSIYDLVGDKIREIFDAQVVMISIFDPQNQSSELVYLIENGERFYLRTGHFGAVAQYLVENRKTIVMNSAEEMTAFGMHTIPGTNPVRSGVWVPLFAGNEVKGTISLQHIDREHAFSDSDVRLLETLANSMSVALENARLFEETNRLLNETRQRNAELAIINSVQHGLASRLDLQAIYELVGDQVREITGAQTVVINRFDVETDTIYYEYVYEKGARFTIPPRPLSPLNRYFIELGRTFVRNENVAELLLQYQHTIPAGEMPRSVVAVPLTIQGKSKGSISLQNMDREHAFRESDVRLVETLANSMSVALENALLFDEIQRLLKETEQRNAELAIINSVQEGLAAQLDYQAIIDLVGDKIREVFQADTTYICLYNPQDQLLQFPYYIERGHRHHKQLKFGEGLTSHIITTRQPLLLNSDSDMRAYGVVYQQSPDATQDRNQTYLGVPFFIGSEVRGVVSVQNYREYAYSESDLRLLTTVAASMGVALENARLFAETQQRAAELATVNTVSQALVAETELDALIHLTGEQVRSTFNADIVYVALLDQQTNLIHFPYMFGEEFTTLKLGEGLTSKIIETAQPLLINRDIESRRAAMGTTLVGKQSRSYLGVPIISGKQAIGVISIQSIEEEGRFTESDSRLLSTIAANVSTAIRNASLFDQVRRQKQYYETIIANSPAAIVLIDMGVNVTGWNPAAERLFGYNAAEAIGRNIDDLVANRPDIYNEAVSYSTRGIMENQIHNITQRTRKDGSLVDVEIMALPVAVDGVQTGFIAIYHDITELQRARQQAIEANQAKSTFLANMSHELRTPLNAIIGFTRIVRRKGEGVLPEKQAENLDKVLVSAEHLLGLINTVLDIAKIEAGRMDVHPSAFDVRSLIDLATTTTQPLVRQDQVRLVTDVADNLPRVYSDVDKVKQILLNLLSNAAKFTHQGRITITARQQDQLMVVSVADTGIGISTQALAHVFEEFQQADSSTTRQYGGTGLGLSISHSLAHLLGGDLTAESQEGHGSKFTLTIPLRYTGGTPAQPGQLSSPTQSTLETDDRPVVLVIDDHPDAVALLRENLEEAGYRVVAALSGEEGLRLANELQPFAITLDILLPNKDGWQVLNDLKASPATRRLPVIMTSIVDKKAFGFRLGAADYLVKPLDEKEVLASLARLAQTSGRGVPRRVLVIDDDPAVADMVAQLLENSHTVVESAADGQLGLEAVLASPPDVILLDLLMPRLDGFKVIEKLRELPATSQVPVIVLTAKSLSEAEAESLQSSVVGIIRKQGLRGEDLLRQIHGALEGERTA